MEKQKNKIIHIGIIILGSIFIMIGLFHKNMWFDETYTVALVKHSFYDIWMIGGNDVHPTLYYFMLKLINIITGGNIIGYRLFSALGIVILGLLGFTHIKKDFGEKTGILFSFFSFFLPVIPMYASEIRMYSWAAVFVTITAIYSYRLTKMNKAKNWILFGIFSLCSLYTHYYSLMAAGLINLLLFVYFIKRKEIRNKYVKPFFITGFIQFFAYIPWLYFMYLQVKNVSKGFWISLSFPGTIFEILQFQCLGNFDERIACLLAFSLFTLAFSTMYKNSKKISDTQNQFNPGKQAIVIYSLVILAAGLLSIKSPILYPRYLFTVSGLLIFFWSYFLARTDAKKTLYSICILMISSTIYGNIRFSLINYNETNMKQIEYISENIKKEDVIIFKNQDLGAGSVIETNFEGYKTLFYDAENWNVEKAYEAYGPDMKTIHNLDVLDEIKGRIWVIDSDNYDLFNEISKKYEVNLIEKRQFKTKYKGYNYNFALITK